MKILITGSNGQVGFELCRALSVFGQILAPTRQELDLSDAQAVADYLKQEQPDLIANAAAYTAVDKAETDVAQARRLNAELPAQFAAYAKANNIRLVHYSSDYVYPGTGSEAFSEASETGPLGVYGLTKLEGDQAISASGCEHLIFRTSWVYSARGNNFMKTMLRLAQDKSSLNIVGDQIGSPTPARLIAQITALAVHSKIPSGLYHLAPRGETSWHGFAQAIFKQALISGEQLALTAESVQSIPTRDYPTPAQRPLNSRMQLNRLEIALDTQLPDWQSQLALTLNEYLEK